MAKGFIIAGYPGVGKTIFCNHAVDLGFDLDSSEYDKKDGWEHDYVAKAIDLAIRGWVVFISTHKKVLEELDRLAGSHGVFASVLFPSLNLKDWWLERLKLRYNISGNNGDYNAYIRAYNWYDSDISDIIDMCNKKPSNLFSAKIIEKSYNLNSIVEELKKINDDCYGEDMSKIEDGLSVKIPVTFAKDSIIGDVYSTSSSDDSGTITDGKEHHENSVDWEIDEDGNYTGWGYIEDSNGNKHCVHDAVYRIPSKNDKPKDSEVDILDALRKLNERLDKIEESMNKEDEGRDYAYMEDFVYRLLDVWEKCPHIRFGQFIDNAIYDEDMFYIEDDELLDMVEHYYCHFPKH